MSYLAGFTFGVMLCAWWLWLDKRNRAREMLALTRIDLYETAQPGVYDGVIRAPEGF